MTLKVVAVLLDKVREERVTSAAVEINVNPVNLGHDLMHSVYELQLSVYIFLRNLQVHFMLTFTHRVIFVAE